MILGVFVIFATEQVIIAIAVFAQISLLKKKRGKNIFIQLFWNVLKDTGKKWNS